jgi:hydroxylaminobenzene mutase
MNHLDLSRRLLWHGLVVFLLGLVSGLAILMAVHIFTNPRLALSSHVIGVTTGMFLMLNGLFLDRLRLSDRAVRATFWMNLYGAYGNWGGTVLAAVFGTQTLTTVTGNGSSGAAWQEMLVGVLLTTSGTGTMIACGIFLWGLRPPAEPKNR